MGLTNRVDGAACAADPALEFFDGVVGAIDDVRLLSTALPCE